MEGILFYWFSWIGWVVVTFFFKKNVNRDFFAFLFLVLIITADFSVILYGTEFSIGFILLYLSAFMYSSNIPNKKLPYLIICNMILSMSYVIFYLFSIFDPVWLLFNPTFMLGGLLTYIVLLLVKEKEMRIMTLVFGVCTGELVLLLIMDYFSFPYMLGNITFFDVVALGFLLVSSWNGIEIIISYFNHSVIKSNKRKAGI